jgi:hypothetical protein
LSPYFLVQGYMFPDEARSRKGLFQCMPGFFQYGMVVFHRGAGAGGNKRLCLFDRVTITGLAGIRFTMKPDIPFFRELQLFFTH